jgi:adenylyltransferase/sulfurtransferase
MDLNSESIERYSRNILLPEIGGKGQSKLLESSVLVIGAGGLGSPLLMYLASSGIGNITIIDHDKVELSNLQRQIIHNIDNITKPKVVSAKKFLLKLNPNINIISDFKKIDENNITHYVKKHDIIADGSDNFDTRYLVADSCFTLKKTLVSAAITKFEGQISTWRNDTESSPCYRCLFPNKPSSINSQNCSSNGVLGSVAGFMGSIQATEVIKEILSIGETLSGYLNIYDMLNNNFRKIKINKDQNCNFCKIKSVDEQ